MKNVNVNIDLEKTLGKIKPMHAVNNGPIRSVRGGGSMQYFEEAGIPYARLHDSAFHSAYGGEFSVDVHRIFRNFDADETNPDSYIFEPTDDYLDAITQSGTKIYYRLGAAIEHYFKFGTRPPKDFAKWARICEHIIRHYTEGWANGFHYDIEYWEIWNEPDCTNPDGTKPCWQGSIETFAKFFTTAFAHLKACFPRLKIGGPAFAYILSGNESDVVLSAMKEAGLKPDFYSFHAYCYDPKFIKVHIARARELLTKYGMADVEMHLNEWNYIRGWLDEPYRYSMETIKNGKGAAFTLATMCVCQDTPLDLLMYYDAAPCSYNTIFDNYFQPLKGFNAFKAFNALYRLGTEVHSQSDDETVYALAATNGEKSALVLVYFDDNDGAAPKDVRISLSGRKTRNAAVHLADDANDLNVVGQSVISENAPLNLHMKNHDIVLIELHE